MTREEFSKKAREMTDRELLLLIGERVHDFDVKRCIRHEERIRQIFGVGIGAWALILVLAGVLMRIAIG